MTLINPLSNLHEKAQLQSIDDGVAFLLRNQGNAGDWQDFLLPVGPAQAWVTALIGRLLLVSGRTDAQCAARDAADWLNNMSPNGQWSYNKDIECDCDSTSWAALLFQALPGTDHRADMDFIRSHQTPEGGFSTYRAQDAWGDPHVCVTPVAMLALSSHDATDTQAFDWLLGRRTDQGTWSGYWWASAYYPTLMASTVLTHVRGPAVFDPITTLRAPELAHIRSVLDLSCALLLTCLAQNAAGPTSAMIDTLRCLQLSDGSWPASRCLQVTPHWISPNDVQNMEGLPGRAYCDVNRLMTTAFAIAALAVATGTGEWL